MTRTYADARCRGRQARHVPRLRRAMIALCTVLLLGCGGLAEDIAFSSEELAALELPPEIEIPPPPTAAPLGPRLIRRGSARIEVEDLEAALDMVRHFAEDRGGFVAGSDLREGHQGARTASLLLRRPSDSFQAAVDQLSGVGRILSVSVSASDVSREYFDTETRLAVKEATVQRLRELASRTGDLADVLAAERELSRAISELESLKGQIRYYDQRLALSELDVRLTEPGALIATGAFSPVTLALRDAAGVLGKSVAYIVYLAVFSLPWLALALLLWPLARRIPLPRRAQAASAGAARQSGRSHGGHHVHQPS